MNIEQIKDQIGLTTNEIKDFGLVIENFVIFETIEELKQFPPTIVISECIQNITFMQNNFKPQSLKKKERYVTSVAMYKQIAFNHYTNTKILKPANIQFKNLYKPYFGQDLSNKTILVWRTGGLGDLLFIQPNLNYIKEKYPSCKIKFACGPQYKSMVETWKCIDELLVLPFSMNELIRSDYHILFEGVIERCKEAETENCYKLFTKWIGLNLEDNLLKPKQEPKLKLVEYCKAILKQNFKIDGTPFVLMQLRASSPIRTPSLNVWKKIADYVIDKGYDIIITDSPNQKTYIDNFIKLLNNPNKAFNFAPCSSDIDHSIALTSMAEIAIATDSSIVHIANSLDVKNIGIYGSFPGKIRLDTYDKNICKWIDCKKECAPCFSHGHNPCRFTIRGGFSPCYDNLDMNEFIEKFEELIKEK